jgi:mannose-6-phosphate isomerase
MTPIIKEYIWGEEQWYELDSDVLVKKIIAREKLSVQVHPSIEVGGKDEMWYVLDCVENATIVNGFSCEVTLEDIRLHIKNNTLEDILQVQPVQKGDIILIKAGTVHALGAGIELLEVQNKHGVTYRLYDYNRTDKYGNLRELHIEEALTALNLKE